MKQTWTFGKILGAGYALAALVLLGVALLGARTTANLIRNDEMVDHSHQVRRALASLTAALVELEDGQRGYVVTGSDAYLALYNEARPRLTAVFDQVSRLTADNAAQQRRWQALSPLLDARMALHQKVIALRRDQGFDAARALIAAGEGRDLMLQIRRIVTEADNEEAALLAERAQSAASAAAWAMGGILGGGAAGLALVAAIGWFTVRALTSRIGSAVALVESSSAELQAAANQQASGAKEQAGAMNEIATTIRELIASSHQIAESARKVAQIAQDTDAGARAGDGTVETANLSISGIRQQVDLVVTHMLELGRKSQQIGAILDIVSELAEQTNILAINATIEAAGAGQSGTRFAVVADEIRKLADRVGGSAKEIRVLIDDVRAAVNTTVMATESGSKAVDAGSRQFGEVAVAFRQISQLVAVTTEAAREIELSTKQQSTAVEQVNVAISSVAQATRETEASSGQILQTSSELTGLSRDLARIIRAAA